MKKWYLIAALVVFLLSIFSLSWADPVIREIYYQKKTTLTYPKTYTFRFSLWTDETSIDPLAMVWSEEQVDFRLKNATIKTYLGSNTPLDPAAFGEQLWVQVERLKKGEYVVVGTRDKLSVMPFALSAGHLDIAQGSHIGAATNDTFTYDDDSMGWYSIGWKPDSSHPWGNSAWIAGYGGIKLFTGGMQPAVTIGYWGETWLSNSLTVNGNISKTGTVSFVERHPTDSSKAIVYVSLEGGEAGTYCRGAADLQNGTARIELPEHFSLVTSNEGLTVQVTPTGPCNGLYVVSRSNTFIEVSELGNGTSNVSFDWIVHGIRKGYESYDPISSDPDLLKSLD